MKRFHQILLIGTFLPLCWLLLQAVHELGHVAAALATGGTVSQVVLHPLTISRTDAWGSSHPVLVVWAGPALGVLLPLALLGLARALNWRLGYLARFFAGGCLVGNGAYVAAGALLRGGDGGDLLRMGASSGPLWLFAAITLPLGLWLWNGLGPKFGLGPGNHAVDRRAAYLSAGLLALVVILELALSSR